MPTTTTTKRRSIRPGWKLWLARARTIRATLRGIKNDPPPMGDKWIAKQLTYHQKRLDDHLERQPIKYVE